MKMHVQELWTPQQTAEALAVQVTTLAKWRAQRRVLPFVKLAEKAVRYRPEDVAELIANRTILAEAVQ